MKRLTDSDDLIPIVDVFAGPGGLGEGFARFSAQGNRKFRLALSLEKDPVACRTLRLRAFARCFDHPSREYLACLEGEISEAELFDQYPKEARIADARVLQLELSRENSDATRRAVQKVVPSHGPWVLIGGPPCQAYSVIGRVRNRGKVDYRPDEDQRQKLYVEYLQILGDHAPTVFVMENVKGLLSAQLNGLNIFNRIVDDLRNPSAALHREGRSRPLQAPTYRILSLVTTSAGEQHPASFVVKAERYGIPQARHRVILLGIRDNSSVRNPSTLKETASVSVRQTIENLPRIRSGLSKQDSSSAWRSALSETVHRRWFRKIDTSVQAEVRRVLNDVSIPRAGRGGEVLRRNASGSDYYPLVLNHSARGHIASDIERYLFASCYAKVHGVSPPLNAFRAELQPDHESAKARDNDVGFADRFRVQLAARPSTTITSHISKDGHYYIHYDPTQCRSLTVREAARLQTFPDDYFFCGPRTAQYHQVGNAVPPLLAEQIAGLINAVLD
jgi:DNA (cytosine-5)-methyltransferase 1